MPVTTLTIPQNPQPQPLPQQNQNGRVVQNHIVVQQARPSTLQRVTDVAMTAAVGGLVAGAVSSVVAPVVHHQISGWLVPPTPALGHAPHLAAFAVGDGDLPVRYGVGPGPLNPIDPGLDPSTWGGEPAPGPLRIDHDARQTIMDNSADAMAMAAGTGLGIAVFTPILTPVLGPAAAYVGPVIGSGIGAGIVAIGRLIRGR